MGERPLTDNGLVIGTGAAAPPRAIAALTDGQIVVGRTGYPPVPASITSTVRAVPAVWVRVVASAVQSIPDNAVTALTCDTEVVDTDAMHSTVTNPSRLTCTVAGVYVIGGAIDWAAVTLDSYRFVEIRLNGTTRLISEFEDVAPTGGLPGPRRDVTTAYVLAVNDYVELTAFTLGDGSQNAQVLGFWAVRQGA